MNEIVEYPSANCPIDVCHPKMNSIAKKAQMTMNIILDEELAINAFNAGDKMYSPKYAVTNQ